MQLCSQSLRTLPDNIGFERECLRRGVQSNYAGRMPHGRGGLARGPRASDHHRKCSRQNLAEPRVDEAFKILFHAAVVSGHTGFMSFSRTN